MSKGVLPTYVSVYHMPVWCRRMPEEVTRSLGTGVIHGFKLLCGCWESNLVPLEEQPVKGTLF